VLGAGGGAAPPPPARKGGGGGGIYAELLTEGFQLFSVGIARQFPPTLR